LKKRYQNTPEEAIREFQQLAQRENRPIQIVFPIQQVLEYLQQGLGALMRQVGLGFASAVMEEEVEQRVGPRSQANAERQSFRWGAENGYCVVDGQRIPIPRPRVRSKEGLEVRLGSYELFHRGSLMEDSVWQKILQGLTMRSYKRVVQEFSDAYGIEKSAISGHFIAASQKKLEKLLARSLKDLPLVAMIVDGTIFKKQDLVVALGVDAFGNKHVLGIEQGATENSEVVSGLFGDLQKRGLDFSQPRLYVIDGNAALRRTVEKFAGTAAFVQRCQVHKIRNVSRHLPESRSHAVKFQMRAAYSATDYEEGKQALQKIHDDLTKVNVSAARSLAEGLEDTLMVHRLNITGVLRQSLSSTNGIESSFSVVERICRQVKRWQGGDQRLRWIASSLIYLEGRWNRLQGYKQIPQLMKTLRQQHEQRQKELQRTKVKTRRAIA
jgi:transposase-like protein